MPILAAVLPALEAAGTAIGGAASSVGSGALSALGMGGGEGIGATVPTAAAGGMSLDVPGGATGFGEAGMLPGAAGGSTTTGAPAGGGGIGSLLGGLGGALGGASKTADEINPIAQLLKTFGGDQGGGGGIQMPSLTPEPIPNAPSVYPSVPAPSQPGLFELLRAMQLQG